MSRATPTGTRPLKLIVTHSRLFRAHWALFVPHAGSETVGTKIHVTGTLAEGFAHEFQRDFDLESDAKGCGIFLLGSVDDGVVADLRGEPVSAQGTSSASNRLEEIALDVPAPGPSLRSSSSTDFKPIEVRDCQSWMAQFIAALVAEGAVAHSVAEALAKVPVH
ncbi:hypothetical protein PsYK624_028990 [Phanerochaete sordida]|uniref:Uncharacterized protein n=1 Tax=Phanerochaete sordida TaxID=48140 RepID=A0A9P3L935_9APHY|nr:hypothetical protein PsYK624_028990 [Phanerochaete sordida]